MFKETDRKWLAWAIVVALVLVSTITGVSFPIPPIPEAVDIGAQGVQQGRTDLTGLRVAAPTTIATATAAVVVNSLDVSNIFEVRDAATPVFAVEDGGTLNFDGAAAFSLDADTASNINVAGAGIDLTIESEAGRVIIKGDEAAANAVTIDANDAVTTGVDIDVGSVSGMTIDGGLLDIGGGTCGTADGDNDVCIAAVLEVDGAIDADSTLNVAGAVTLQGALYSSFANLAVSDGDTITPTYTTYALDTSGAVTITLNATGQEGQLLVIINDDANATIIADTNLRSSDGNAITLAGALDVVMFIYQDAEWLLIATSANS